MLNWFYGRYPTERSSGMNGYRLSSHLLKHTAEDVGMKLTPAVSQRTGNLIGGIRRRTGEDWMIEVLVMA